LADSPIITVTAGKYATVLTIDVRPRSGPSPLSVVVDGYLKTIEGFPVPLRSVMTFHNGDIFRNVQTDTSGYYALSVDGLEPGTHTFQTKFAGDDLYEGCEKGDGTIVTGGVPTISPLIPLAIAGSIVIGAIAFLWSRKKRI
jgi:hypothetical protein